MSQAQNELLRSMLSEVTENLTNNLRDVLTKSLEAQLTEALTNSLLESEFYRKISKDMRGGLKKIYKELASTQVNNNPEISIDKDDTAKLFHEASSQLESVIEQTEVATDEIMSLVEKHLDLQNENAKLLAKAKDDALSLEEFEKLEKNNFSLSEDLTTILTSLSFQDLTGQRIKRAVRAIHSLETTVLDLLLSSGIMIKAYEEKPNANIEELEIEANKAAIDIRQKVQGSELKGPDGGNTQANIDDLLSQLGL